METRIIEPKLSYTIMGLLFDIHNSLGNSAPEKVYQRALEIQLNKNNIHYAREKYVPILYESEQIGKYFLDFIIENTMIIETKTVPFLDMSYQQQIFGYMKTLKIRLGILVNFRPPKLEYRRFVLPDRFIVKNS